MYLYSILSHDEKDLAKAVFRLTARSCCEKSEEFSD